MGAGKFAGGVSGFLVPWESEGPGWKLTFLGEIDKGREQEPLFDCSWRGQLWNGNHVS